MTLYPSFQAGRGEGRVDQKSRDVAQAMFLLFCVPF